LFVCLCIQQLTVGLGGLGATDTISAIADAGVVDILVSMLSAPAGPAHGAVDKNEVAMALENLMAWSPGAHNNLCCDAAMLLLPQVVPLTRELLAAQRSGRWLSAVFGVLYYMSTTGSLTASTSEGAEPTTAAGSKQRAAAARALLELVDQLLLASEIEFTDRDLVTKEA
jgi:hypothetical protein